MTGLANWYKPIIILKNTTWRVCVSGAFRWPSLKLSFCKMKTLHDEKHVLDSQKLKRQQKKRSFKNPVHNNFSCGFQPEYFLPQLLHCFMKRQLSRNFKTSSTIKIELLHEKKLFTIFFQYFFVSQQLQYKQKRSFKSTVHNYFICGLQIYKVKGQTQNNHSLQCLT